MKYNFLFIMKNYIPRTLEKSLTSVSPSRAYMLYGARQVGKTSLLRHMLANQNVEWLTGESSTDRERLQYSTGFDRFPKGVQGYCD